MSERLEVDGIDVFVEGDGDESIIMIHGWPDTCRLWDAQVAFFRDRYRCVRFTLPGFDIAKPRRAFTLAETLSILGNIIDRVCPDRRVILMLHDWGCAFGYQFAMLNPSRVSAIVGVDIGDAGTKAYVRSLGAKAKDLVFAYQMWLALAWRIGGGLGDWMTRWLARAIRCPSDPRFIGSCMDYPYYIAWFKAHGSYRAMVRVEPPAFRVRKAQAVPLSYARWADALAARPGNAVRAFRTGHWVMSEQPREFNEAVDAWLAGR